MCACDKLDPYAKGEIHTYIYIYTYITKQVINESVIQTVFLENSNNAKLIFEKILNKWHWTSAVIVTLIHVKNSAPNPSEVNTFKNCSCEKTVSSKNMYLGFDSTKEL